MIILTAHQKPEKDPTTYSCNLIDCNTSEGVYVVELNTDNPRKPPIKIITDSEEIESITAKNTIKSAYEYASMTSNGDILVEEYATVRISGWMSEEHKWWNIIGDDDSFIFFQDPVYDFHHYRSIVEHNELEGGIKQDGRFDQWRSFAIHVISKYKMEKFDNMSEEERHKTHMKHIDDFMWKNYDYFDDIVNKHKEEMKKG